MKAGEDISKKWTFNDKYWTNCHTLPSSMFKAGNIHWAYWCGIAHTVNLLLLSTQLKRAHCSEQHEKPVVSSDFKVMKTKADLSAEFHQWCESVHHIVIFSLGVTGNGRTCMLTIIYVATSVTLVPLKLVPSWHLAIEDALTPQSLLWANCHFYGLDTSTHPGLCH